MSDNAIAREQMSRMALRPRHLTGCAGAAYAISRLRGPERLPCIRRRPRPSYAPLGYEHQSGRPRVRCLRVPLVRESGSLRSLQLAAAARRDETTATASTRRSGALTVSVRSRVSNHLWTYVDSGEVLLTRLIWRLHHAGSHGIDTSLAIMRVLYHKLIASWVGVGHIEDVDLVRPDAVAPGRLYRIRESTEPSTLGCLVVFGKSCPVAAEGDLDVAYVYWA